MNGPLVFALELGRLLVWVEDGRGYLAERIPGTTQTAYTPWRRLAEETLPGVGGRVLTASEVARLVAPARPEAA